MGKLTCTEHGGHYKIRAVQREDQGKTRHRAHRNKVHKSQKKAKWMGDLEQAYRMAFRVLQWGREKKNYAKTMYKAKTECRKGRGAQTNCEPSLNQNSECERKSDEKPSKSDERNRVLGQTGKPAAIGAGEPTGRAGILEHPKLETQPVETRKQRLCRALSGRSASRTKCHRAEEK